MQLESEVPTRWLLSGLDGLLQTFGRLRSLGLRWSTAVTEEHLQRCLSQCARLERLQLQRPHLTVQLSTLRRLQAACAPRLRVEVVIASHEHHAVLDLRRRVISTDVIGELLLRSELQAELGETIGVVRVG